MITTIDLRNMPCFDEKAKLTDLRQVNFIFGPNGAGKTTITRAAKAQLTAGSHTVHVYNHDYVSNIRNRKRRRDPRDNVHARRKRRFQARAT